MSSLFRPGQGELKYSAAARFVRSRPQPAPMCFDYGSADRQPHPHSAGLRGVESIENALETCRINTWSRIAHCKVDITRLAFFSADQQISCPHLDGAHCLDRVRDQVHDDLLQLNTIP